MVLPLGTLPWLVEKGKHPTRQQDSHTFLAHLLCSVLQPPALQGPPRPGHTRGPRPASLDAARCPAVLPVGCSVPPPRFSSRFISHQPFLSVSTCRELPFPLRSHGEAIRSHTAPHARIPGSVRPPGCGSRRGGGAGLSAGGRIPGLREPLRLLLGVSFPSQCSVPGPQGTHGSMMEPRKPPRCWQLAC